MPVHGVGAEHPLNDRLQILFLIVFIVVWVVDSFFLHYALNVLGIIVLAGHCSAWGSHFRRWDFLGKEI